MFSGEQDDRGDSPPTSVIVLSVDQFEIIFQVTNQLPNFQESRLLELGCTATDLRKLVGALREIDARMAGAERVCIGLRDDEAELAVEVNDVGASGAEVVAALPLRIGRRWYALAQLVISALGSRELFLRTGYGSDEVQAAVAGLALN
ncbi:hypothetical protein AB0C74_36935 [Spirillospora sp. NPDC048832]